MLGHVQPVAAIAIRHGAERGARFGGKWQGAAHECFGAGQQQFKRGIIQALQHQHLAAGQKGAVQREGWVFRGGANQRHGAVFHHGQKAILLRAVEAVDFIHEKQRALAVGFARAGFFKGALQIGDAGKHGGKGGEAQPRRFGQ